jgi:L-serine dehydratase
MSFLFESFEGWKNYCEEHKLSLSDSVLEYELNQKGRNSEQTLAGLRIAWQVMKEAVKTGLEENMTSRSGMINNGAKKVYNFPKAVLSREFQDLISRALAAKEVNSCMGRIVARQRLVPAELCRVFCTLFKRSIRSRTKK